MDSGILNVVIKRLFAKRYRQPHQKGLQEGGVELRFGFQTYLPSCKAKRGTELEQVRWFEYHTKKEAFHLPALVTFAQKGEQHPDVPLMYALLSANWA